MHGTGISVANSRTNGCRCVLRAGITVVVWVRVRVRVRVTGKVRVTVRVTHRVRARVSINFRQVGRTLIVAPRDIESRSSR